MPSEIDPSGDGVMGDPNGLANSAGEGEETIRSSERAIVGAALAAFGDPDAALPKAGRRPTENLDVVDIREALEPGRKGEGNPGT